MPRYIDADLIPYTDDDDYLSQYAYRYDINEITTADVVPKSEVEALEQSNEDLRNVLANTLEKYRNCKAEVAKEIFEEIEKLIFSYGLGIIENDRVCNTIIIDNDRFAEYRKKHTEGKAYDNAERCVVCGEVIPEGRQVCPMCEKQNTKGGLQ